MPIPINFLPGSSTLLLSPLPPPSPEFMSSLISHQKMGFMFVIVIVFILFLFICIFHYFQYRLRLYQTRTLDIEQRFHANHAVRVFSRLQAEIIRQRQAASARTQPNAAEHEETSSTTTTVAYKDTIKITDKAGSDGCCAICIEEFEEEEICGIVESCGHCFHKDCMYQWLKIESRCPLCRCLVHVESHNNNNSQENQA